MDAKDDRYEEMLQRVYFESQFQDLTSSVAEDIGQEESVWFALSEDESRRYLETLLGRISIEEQELEKLFETPEAERIYRRVEFGAQYIDSSEPGEKIDLEVKTALLISAKLRWVAQKDLAQELLALLRAEKIGGVAISNSDELVPVHF